MFYLRIVKAIVRWVNILQSLPALLLGHIKRIFITRFAKHAVNRRDDLFSKFTAELNVHAAACHVGGDGHCAKRACARNDL